MKVHLSESHPEIDGSQKLRAEEVWRDAGLVPYVVRSCTGLMVANEHSLTKDIKKVTCKHCLKKQSNSK